MLNLRSRDVVQKLLKDPEARASLSPHVATGESIKLVEEAKELVALAHDLSLLAGKRHAEEFQKAKQTTLVQGGHKFGYLAAEALRSGTSNVFRFFLLFPPTEMERQARLAHNPRAKILFRRKSIRMVAGKYPDHVFEKANNVELQALAGMTERFFGPLRRQSSHLAKARAQLTYALKNLS